MAFGVFFVGVVFWGVVCFGDFEGFFLGVFFEFFIFVRWKLFSM